MRLFGELYITIDPANSHISHVVRLSNMDQYQPSGTISLPAHRFSRGFIVIPPTTLFIPALVQTLRLAFGQMRKPRFLGIAHCSNTKDDRIFWDAVSNAAPCPRQG